MGLETDSDVAAIFVVTLTMSIQADISDVLAALDGTAVKTFLQHSGLLRKEPI